MKTVIVISNFYSVKLVYFSRSTFFLCAFMLRQNRSYHYENEYLQTTRSIEFFMSLNQLSYPADVAIDRGFESALTANSPEEDNKSLPTG